MPFVNYDLLLLLRAISAANRSRRGSVECVELISVGIIIAEHKVFV